jgi:hypothetical protein
MAIDKRGLSVEGSLWFECQGHPSHSQLQRIAASSQAGSSTYEGRSVMISNLHEFKNEQDYASFVSGKDCVIVPGTLSSQISFTP